MERTRRLNAGAVFYPGTGCVRFRDRVVELTVSQEQLIELLIASPVTIPHSVLMAEMAMSEPGLKHLVSEVRLKLGYNAIRTHYGRGYRFNPAMVM